MKTSPTQREQVSKFVPLEPTLKRWRVLLFIGLALLVIYVVTFLLLKPVNTALFGIGSFFSLLWIGFLSYPILYLSRGKQWKTLEEKRQQTVLSSLTLGVPPQSAFRPGISHLPTQLAIRLRRRWATTWLFGIGGGLYLTLLVLFLYAFWSGTVSMVIHQQESLVLGLVQTMLNVVVVLTYLIAFAAELVLTPHQYLIATQDGLVCRYQYHFSYIPWQQARLFAIISAGETKQHRSVFYYELSSETVVIRWSSLPARAGKETPSGTVGITGWLAQADISVWRYEQDIQTLNAMVATRTGLPFYDLR